MKNKNGYVCVELIWAIVICIGIIIIALYKGIFGNKKILDLNYTFKKAIIYMNDEKIELDIKRWNDYDGEQIQIETADGKIYLVSSFNTILISE